MMELSQHPVDMWCIRYEQANFKHATMQVLNKA